MLLLGWRRRLADYILTGGLAAPHAAFEVAQGRCKARVQGQHRVMERTSSSFSLLLFLIDNSSGTSRGGVVVLHRAVLFLFA